jgi:adenine/guanine phosphoribosyltransferase-like PRPP-binding protein
MNLTDEAGRASTRRADSARGFLPAAAIADLAGTDTKVVFVARHQTTIWKSNVIAQDQKCSPRDAA